MSNLTSAVIFFLFYRSAPKSGFPAVFFAGLAFWGLFFALTNGIPIKTRMISNDGYNAISLGKDKLALKSFWLQLKINERQTAGVRLKDMPEEWFRLPDGADMHNPMISTIGVFAENRYMDQQDFAAAKEQMKMLLSDGCTVVGIYKNLLILDQIYLETLEKGADADVSALGDRQMKSFLNSMKNFPSVIRAKYAIAKRVKGDGTEAKKLEARFAKCEKTYPVKADIASEKELMALV